MERSPVGRRWRIGFGALLGLAVHGAHAAIAGPGTGDGELTFVVQDASTQVSYTLDLGVRMSEFFDWGQPDAGVQRFWVVDDANWASFAGQATLAGAGWAVFAGDSVGPVVGANQRLFTTATQGQEALIAATTNQSLRSGIAPSALGNFVNGVNITGSHVDPATGLGNNYDLHGSSVNALADPGISYFGEPGGAGPRLQGNALSFSMMNAIGQSSWFYSLGSAAATGTVVVDEFDNLGHDGYWGFTFVDPNTNPNSPYAGKYLLSYTIAPALVQAQVATPAGRLRAAMTEYLASGAPTRLIGDPDPALPPLQPVPEPGALALFGAGALALALRRRRR